MKKGVLKGILAMSLLVIMTGCGKDIIDKAKETDNNEEVATSTTNQEEEIDIDVENVIKKEGVKHTLIDTNYTDNWKNLETKVPSITVHELEKNDEGIDYIIEMETELSYQIEEDSLKKEREETHLFTYPNSAYLDTYKGRIEASLKRSTDIGREIKVGESKKGSVYFLIKDKEDIIEDGKVSTGKIFWRSVLVTGNISKDDEKLHEIDFTINP